GRFVASVKLSDLVEHKSARLMGELNGPLGAASGGGTVRLSASGAGTHIDYDYAVSVSGKAAQVGGRLLDGATAVVMRQFFERLASHVKAPAKKEKRGFFGFKRT